MDKKIFRLKDGKHLLIATYEAMFTGKIAALIQANKLIKENDYVLTRFYNGHLYSKKTKKGVVAMTDKEVKMLVKKVPSELR